MNEHDELRTSVGAYVLGALDRSDHDAMANHISHCSVCRDEVATLTMLPGILAQVDPDRAAALDGHESASEQLLPRLLAAVRREHRVTARKTRRWQYATVMSVAAAALLAAFLVHVPTAGDPRQRALTSVNASVTARGEGTLTTKPWGTEVQVRLSGLPRSQGFTLIAAGRDGRREVASTWGPTADDQAVITGATSLHGGDLDHVEVVSSTGQRLLILPNIS